MKWERVTIFISSTFNDMHAERGDGKYLSILNEYKPLRKET